MKGIVIHDGKGYWCAMRRIDGRLIHLWSTKIADAGRFHFIEAAQKIAESIPQPVVFKLTTL